MLTTLSQEFPFLVAHILTYVLSFFRLWCKLQDAMEVKFYSFSDHDATFKMQRTQSFAFFRPRCKFKIQRTHKPSKDKFWTAGLLTFLSNCIVWMQWCWWRRCSNKFYMLNTVSSENRQISTEASIFSWLQFFWRQACIYNTEYYLYSIYMQR